MSVNSKTLYKFWGAFVKFVTNELQIGIFVIYISMNSTQKVEEMFFINQKTMSFETFTKS